MIRKSKGKSDNKQNKGLYAYDNLSRISDRNLEIAEEMTNEEPLENEEDEIEEETDDEEDEEF